MSAAAPVPPPPRPPKKRRTGLIVFLLLAAGALCVGVPLVFCGLMSAGAPRIENGAVISLRFDGAIPDGPSTDPFAELSNALGGGGPMSLHDLRTLVDAVENDDKIAGVLVEIGPLAEGMGKIEEVRDILGRLKGKKKVYAFLNADFVMEDTYYLATIADKIVINPEAGLALNGFEGEVTFWRGTLEKLHIKPDVIMFKEYKSAGEPFKNKEMSPAFEEWLSSVLNEYYARIVAATVQSRGLDEATVKQLFEKGGQTAKQALAAKLVDATGYIDELEEELRLAHAPDQKERKLVGGRRYLASKRGFGAKGEKVAVIYAMGPIMSAHGTQGIFGGEGISGPNLAKTVREAAKDDSVKAIVLRVDSPGGSAIGSDYVRREIELAKAKKPVVVSMGAVAGSGGYWISMEANKIVAQPSTLTGSIGVVFTKMNLRGFFEWMGANLDGVQVGPNANILSASHNLTAAQEATMREWMQEVYDDFVNHVARSRKKSYEDAEKLARGRVWTGAQAKDNGLVDELGGLDKAVELALAEANLAGKEHQLVIFPRQKNFFEALAEGMEGASVSMRRQAAPIEVLDALEDAREELETPKVMTLMPEIEVN